MEFKKRGKLINNEWKEPWKSYNPNCAKCMYKNPEHTWASMGTCNYAGVTGKPRIIICKAKDCPGFPGKRIIKKNSNPLECEMRRKKVTENKIEFRPCPFCGKRLDWSEENEIN